MSDGYKTGYQLEDNSDSWIGNPDAIKKLHTKQLLDLRISQAARNSYMLHQMIKEELATREHVPTKEEAKEIRKKKAKEKKNR